MLALQPVLQFDSPLLEHVDDVHQGLRPDVWHADTLAGAPHQVQSTGNAVLDAQLPGGGWPVGAMTEVLQPAHVHSEWRLLLPALARSGQGPVVLVGAPQVPFAPALAAQGLHSQRLLRVGSSTCATAERLWATEQALRCAAVDAVMLWLPQGTVRTDQLRRLQMAAASHQKLLFVMRDTQARAEASPAVLRLEVLPASQDTLEVHLIKRRGPPQEEPLQLAAWPPRLALLLAAATHQAPQQRLTQPLRQPLPRTGSYALARTARVA
jgi:protein ImuA